MTRDITEYGITRRVKCPACGTLNTRVIFYDEELENDSVWCSHCGAQITVKNWEVVKNDTK